MSACPSCGLPPTAMTENDKTGEAFYECQNMHQWPVEADPPPSG